MVNYFELYGLPMSFHPDAATVKSKFYELSRKYHPDRFTMAGDAEQAEALKMSSVNNEAYKILKAPYATMAYILKEHEILEDEEKYNLPPDFLMEMMELNESLSEYEMEPGNQELLDSSKNMLEAQLQQWEEEVAPLTKKYDEGDHSKELLLQIKEHYFRKKYLLRIKERMAGMS